MDNCQERTVSQPVKFSLHPYFFARCALMLVSAYTMRDKYHKRIEEPGLKILAQDLRTAFEDTKVVFHQ